MDNLHNSIYGIEKKFSQYSLRLLLTNIKPLHYYSIIYLLMVLIFLVPESTFIVLFYLLNSLYLVAQIFKLIITIIGALQKPKHININPDLALPIYTLLIPIYKEDRILKHLIKTIEKLDYPADKLDVKLLIEEDDHITLQAIEKIKLESYFELIIIPNSAPKTKPKACNYGLNFARGKYITIFDAEDRPEKLQLKKIVNAFAQAERNVICIQAKLNYYNRTENILTKLFAIEYSLLFDFMLPGLKALSLPIPLGGTSNHFIKDKLIEIGGWDAFNVTEDADLGIRIYHFDYRTELIDSLTLEEAPINTQMWIKQRARWIKGHILTSMLHLQKLDQLKFREFIGILLTLYIPNIIYITLPLYLLLGCFIIDKIKYDFFLAAKSCNWYNSSNYL
jgi:glycosyltransferase XagB